jgi:hypothetical protein
MDDVTKAWMFFNWAEDTSEQNVLLRNQGCLIGSFWNPEAAREIMGEGIKKITTTDQEADNAWQFVVNQRENEQKPSKKKKKKIRIK